MIHIVIGTKAQLIKMAPILKYMQDQNIAYNYISTGQHKATIDDILANFNIKKPNYTLYNGKDITSIIQMLFWLIRNLIHTIKNKNKIFQNDKNGIVLVHGDTFSTLLGAIMAKIAGLKVGHVESGLRSFNIFHPFPEEITRILTFKLADYMFAPGEWAVDNLKNFKNKHIINIQSNTLYDALVCALPAIEKIDTVAIPKQKFAIVTLHRFENISNLKAITRLITLVEQIAEKYFLLFILHKPTEKKLHQFNLYQRLKNNPNIEFRQRYDYFSFIKLILHAYFIVSDGGSNQEECYYLGKPIILLREATERTEGLDKNCILSKYSSDIVTIFINNIENYQKDKVTFSHSPSQNIITHCLPYKD